MDERERGQAVTDAVLDIARRLGFWLWSFGFDHLVDGTNEQ